jgi:hypothetical protein
MTRTPRNIVLRRRPLACAAAMGLLVSLLGAASCGDAVRQGRGSTYLIVDQLEGARGGDTSPTFETVMQSDVQTRGGVFEDPGRVELRLGLKDVTGPTTPTSVQSITVSRYRIVYRRADGRNTQGVDVPYAFDGGVTFTVTSAQTPASATFTIVRAQAKLEPPLRNLVGLGGSVVISSLADITFYGRDQAGNDVSVSGTISINFADWADPS